MFYAYDGLARKTQVPVVMSLKASNRKTGYSPTLPVMIPKEWRTIPLDTDIGRFSWADLEIFLDNIKDMETNYEQGNLFCEIFYSGALNNEKVNIFRFPINSLYRSNDKVYFKGYEWTVARGSISATMKELFEVTEYLDNSWYTSCYVGNIEFERTGSYLRIFFRKATMYPDMYNALQQLGTSGFSVQTNISTLKNPMYIHDVRFVSL